MLRSGKEHLESLRDGRVIYIGSERVDDVTRHPAFRNAAGTVAGLYDLKADPANRCDLTYEEEPATTCSGGWLVIAGSPISPTACSADRPTTSPPSSPAWP